MNAEDVTLGQVRMALRQLVRVSPDDRRNPTVNLGAGDSGGCVYTDRDGSPSCIVGNLAEILGVERPMWENYENTEGVDEAFRFPIIVASYLTAAQGMADADATWAAAFEWAEEETEAGRI